MEGLIGKSTINEGLSSKPRLITIGYLANDDLVGGFIPLDFQA